MTAPRTESYSLRTKAIVVIYLSTCFVWFATLILIVFLVAVGLLGLTPPFRITVWPWFPSTVVVMMIAKYAVRWSIRNERGR